MTIRQEVESVCKQRLGRLPDLANPRGYNDKIQWLKLFDQTEEHVVACDKFAVRELVADLAGENVLVPLLYHGPSYRPLNTFPHIAKASHDSGSATKVANRSEFARASERMTRALSRHYGIGKGEWAYRFIKHRRVMVEECVPDPIVDFKFHCTGGEVRWVQVISERKVKGGPAEAIFTPAGSVTGLHFDHNMRHVPSAAIHPGDYAWACLTELAEILAAGWRYVRVDLYWARQQAYFGELTFWPLAGCYKTKDEPRFGELMELDLSRPTTIVR